MLSISGNLHTSPPLSFTSLLLNRHDAAASNELISSFNSSGLVFVCLGSACAVHSAHGSGGASYAVITL